MTSSTLKLTVAALALTAGSAFAGSDMNVEAENDSSTQMNLAQTDNSALDTATGNRPVDDARDGGAASDYSASSSMNETADPDMDAPLPDSFAGMTVGEVVGLDVETATGEDVGEIDYVIEQGGEHVAIVGVGGFLGLGEHDVAVPLADLSFSEDDEVTLAKWSEEDLKALPDVDEDTINALDDETVIEENLS